MNARCSRVGPKGQVTIPIEIRQRLGLKAGDTVVLSVENGAVLLTPADPALESVAGSIKHPTGCEDFDQMVEDAKEERAARLMRKLWS